MIEGRYSSDMERRIMQGGFTCAGKYRLAPAAPAAWPDGFTVPLPSMRGRQQETPVGTEEGELCFRDAWCQGRLRLERRADMGGCYCFISAPCGSCMSQVPECPRCGHREEEPE